MAGIGSAAAWPMVVRGQQASIPVVGFLNHGSPDERIRFMHRGLSETGYVEGRNLTIEYSWANNELNRLPDLAAHFVRRQVAVIVAAVSTPAALAAKAATTTIPIVFGTGADPVSVGLVASLNRPGGNVTGVAIRNWELGGKRVGLLHESAPGTAPLAIIINPDVAGIAEPFIMEVKAAATTIKREIVVFYVRDSRDIETAFAGIVDKRASAVMIGPDVLLNNHQKQLAELANRYKVPAMFPWRETVEIGGLMSYGPSFADVFALAGVYCGRILKGERAGDLPVQLPTKFELVINLKTAKALGLSVPPAVLALADEVVE